MNMFRIAVLGAAVLFGGSGIWAEEIGAFTISGVGWPSGQSFSANANTGTSIEGFTQSCAVVNSEGGLSPSSACFDPTIFIDPGGTITPVGTEFSFSADANGTINFHGLNVSGETFTDLLITGLNIPVTTGEVFECGGTAFAQCGFQIESDPTVKVLFTGGSGIPTVPEPATWVLLLTTGGAMMFSRLRRRA